MVPTMTPPSGLRLLPLGVLVLAASACGSSQDDPARDVAVRFYSAVADRDGPAACDLLAPETLDEVEQSARRPCPEGLFDEGLRAVRDPAETRVFGTMAQVRYRSETVFLTRFRDGWKVMAAGCAPAAAERYDCRIQGG
jgi:ketosteroid isomerase-like protein